MLAVVKKPRTDKILFEIKGNIPEHVVEYLVEKFGHDFEILEADDDELVKVCESNWYKKITVATTPGERMKMYRENLGLTRAELGHKLGHLPPLMIAEIENNKRLITPDLAAKLCQWFDVPLERFLK